MHPLLHSTCVHLEQLCDLYVLYIVMNVQFFIAIKNSLIFTYKSTFCILTFEFYMESNFTISILGK